MVGSGSNEGQYNGQRVVIKCAGRNTTSVGVTHRMLESLDLVLAAFQHHDGSFDVYSLRADEYRRHMRDSRSSGAAGRVGLVTKKTFTEHGTASRSYAPRKCAVDYGSLVAVRVHAHAVLRNGDADHFGVHPGVTPSDPIVGADEYARLPVVSMLRIATWNLERPRRGSVRRLPGLRARIDAVDADVWVLTETNDALVDLSATHRARAARSPYRAIISPGSAGRQSGRGSR